MKMIINTIASYARTIIGVVFVLFSSRWVLASLGVSDFGIYALVGSILSIVVFMNTILANGNSRFLSIALGAQDENELKNLFKTIVVIHTVIPIVVFILGYFIGIYAIAHWLEIPESRIDSTILLFRIAIVASFFAMIAVPYTASFIANQNIVIYSIITLSQSFLYFLSAYLLRLFQGDNLINYGILMSTSNIIIYSLLIIVAMKKYSFCHSFWKSRFDISKAKEIVRFAFWNFLGSFGHLIRTQGISIIVNLSFGTQGNAALGIANQVATQSANLTNALSSATSPEVYTRIGAKDHASANRLSLSISNIGTCLILLLSSVIIVNLDDLLLIWLKTVPPYSSELCICFILMYILEKNTMGQNTYLSGINKIAIVQTLSLTSYSLAIVFPYLGLMKMFGIVGVGISCVLSMLLAIFSVEFCYYRYSGFKDLKQFFRLLMMSIVLFVTSLLIGKGIANIQILFFVKFCASSLFMIIMVITLFYFFIFNDAEKQIIKAYLSKYCKICVKK